jgi:hypothetical protein
MPARLQRKQTMLRCRCPGRRQLAASDRLARRFETQLRLCFVDAGSVHESSEVLAAVRKSKTEDAHSSFWLGVVVTEMNGCNGMERGGRYMEGKEGWYVV